MQHQIFLVEDLLIHPDALNAPTCSQMWLECLISAIRSGFASIKGSTAKRGARRLLLAPLQRHTTKINIRAVGTSLALIALCPSSRGEYLPFDVHGSSREIRFCKPVKVRARWCPTLSRRVLSHRCPFVVFVVQLVMHVVKT